MQWHQINGIRSRVHCDVSFRFQIDVTATSQRGCKTALLEQFKNFNQVSLKRHRDVADRFQIYCCNATLMRRISDMSLKRLMDVSKWRFYDIRSRVHCDVSFRFQIDVTATSQQGCKTAVLEQFKNFNKVSLKRHCDIADRFQIYCCNATLMRRISDMPLKRLMDVSKRRFYDIRSRVYCDVSFRFQIDVTATSQRGCTALLSNSKISIRFH